jgi:tRNA(Met) C34 N-acetyltransferase TmcA
MENKESKNPIKQPIWDAIDRTLYEDTINKYLRNYCPGNRTTYENLLYVRQILQKAISTAVPTKTLKLKGPKWKASPTVLQLLKICKAKYQFWVENGKQNDKYKVENIMAKRNLRKQMRKGTNCIMM